MNNEEWSWEQEEPFVRALVENQEDNADRWERIAAGLAGKTAEEVKAHYDLLAGDISLIESGLVPLPDYVDDEVQVAPDQKKSRKPSTKWTLEEHKAFLRGIAVLRKGDWRGISRQYVPGRTPIQVASHAQKYFERQGKEQSKKKRRSIHDVSLETLMPATANEPVNRHPAVQSNGSSNGQPIHQTDRPANGTPTLDIDTSTNGSSTHRAPQLRDPPAPAHSTPINLHPQQLTPGIFIPLFRSDDPRASALNIPPLASRAPDTPTQSEQEPHRPRGSLHNPVS
ncbi:transcription factor SRM1-like [Ananas comosus]|uniref:Transcription factor SRM1-like n=1 Tax=Ananas comosus TaxID=4615 RepID=A0A6P5FPX3_ANACO|nr:transcription factor SRM1-like [Ananas comosus]